MAEILLTGATGYVGGRLLPRLLDDGHEVRALSRDPERARLPDGVSVVRGDPVQDAGLDAALRDVDVAFYLIHSMGRGSGPISEFARRDRTAAANFAGAARRAGVGRVVYLGGLGGDGPGASEHLRSRHEVARILAERGPEVTYVRAAMVIGADSASFAMLSCLVRRLPVMVCPRWIDTRTQPVSVHDVVSTLATAAGRPDLHGEVQLGGADVLTYREMMASVARHLDRRPPVVLRLPVLTPRLSSYWVSLITPVEAGLARPLIDGLSEEMIVTVPPPPGVNDSPLGFDDAVRAALCGDRSPAPVT